MKRVKCHHFLLLSLYFRLEMQIYRQKQYFDTLENTYNMVISTTLKFPNDTIMLEFHLNMKRKCQILLIQQSLIPQLYKKILNSVRKKKIICTILYC